MRYTRRLVSHKWFLLLAVTVIAAALRWYDLGRLPPGLYHDEAFNGLDALDVINGARPLFFEANNGREPLFIYLSALSVAVLGRSPLAIRVVAALLGTLTVPATYFMVRELLGKQEAILAAAVTAISFWHVNLSRVGFRAVGLPLATALCLWFYSRAAHRRHRLDFALSGFFLGASVYTYLPARLASAPFVLLIVYLLWRRQPVQWRGQAMFFAAAIAVALPFLVHAGQNADAFLARSAQVSVFNPAISQGDVLGTLIRHTAETLAMFIFRGDFIPRHNMPFRPVFDPAMGFLFLVGLILSARRASHHSEHALLLFVFLVMLLPTILAEDAPHFLRAVGLLPVAFVFPAIGLRALWAGVQARTSRQAALAALTLVLLLSLGSTVRDYFLGHAHSEATYFNFEGGALELAADINGYLGTGWTQESTCRVGRQPPQQQRLVYLDGGLWRDWASLRYLVPATDSLVLLGDAPAPPSAAEQVRLVMWPYRDLSRHLTLLPRERLVSVREGPLERGDLEEEARLLCVTYESAPPSDALLHVGAKFERGIELLGYQIEPEGQLTRLRLFWRATAPLNEDYTVFAHWLRDGTRIAQHDSLPAQGYYPTHVWRPGDIVADDHWMDAVAGPEMGDSISVGMYLLPAVERLHVLDRSNAIVGDAVTLTLP